MRGGNVDVAVAALEAGEVPFLALPAIAAPPHLVGEVGRQVVGQPAAAFGDHLGLVRRDADLLAHFTDHCRQRVLAGIDAALRHLPGRSEEHTSELQSLMRTSYAVFYLKKKTNPHTHIN